MLTKRDYLFVFMPFPSHRGLPHHSPHLPAVVAGGLGDPDMKLTMISGVIACILAVAFADRGQAAEQPAAFGNTVVITTTSGVEKLYMDPDGSFSQKEPDGTTLTGTWSDDGKDTCFTQTHAVSPRSWCAEHTSYKVGDTWTNTGPGGMVTAVITIVAGR
jgi:hypothetical protein